MHPMISAQVTIDMYECKAHPIIIMKIGLSGKRIHEMKIWCYGFTEKLH